MSSATGSFKPKMNKDTLKLAKRLYAVAAPAYKKASGIKMFNFEKASGGSKAAILRVSEYLIENGFKFPNPK